MIGNVIPRTLKHGQPESSGTSGPKIWGSLRTKRQMGKASLSAQMPPWERGLTHRYTLMFSSPLNLPHIENPLSTKKSRATLITWLTLPPMKRSCSKNSPPPSPHSLPPTQRLWRKSNLSPPTTNTSVAWHVLLQLPSLERERKRAAGRRRIRVASSSAGTENFQSYHVGKYRDIGLCSKSGPQHKREDTRTNLIGGCKDLAG